MTGLINQLSQRLHGTGLGLIAFALSGAVGLGLAAIFTLFNGPLFAGSYLQAYAAWGVFSFVMGWGQHFSSLRDNAHTAFQKSETRESKSVFIDGDHFTGLIIFNLIVAIGLFFVFHLMLKIFDNALSNILLVVACVVFAQNKLISFALLGQDQINKVATGQMLRSGSMFTMGIIYVLLDVSRANIPLLILISELVTTVYQHRQIPWVYKMPSLEGFNKFSRYFTKNLPFCLGDVNYEFGPKIQTLIVATMLPELQAARLAFIFAAIEVIPQMSVVFRNKHNGTMLKFQDTENQKIVAQRFAFFRLFNFFIWLSVSAVLIVNLGYIYLMVEPEFKTTYAIGLLLVVIPFLVLGKNLAYTHFLVIFNSAWTFFTVNLISILLFLALSPLLITAIPHAGALVSYALIVLIGFMMISSLKKSRDVV